MVAHGDVLWTPPRDFVDQSNLVAFMEFVNAKYGYDFHDHQSLWAWSVEDVEEFWASMVEFFEIDIQRTSEQVLGSSEMPGAEWFPGSRLNFAEHILRADRGSEAALIALSENRAYEEISWIDLASEVRLLATALRQNGLKPNDRVVSFLPNIKEAAVAFLATSAVGGVFSSCSPDFGAKSVIDRFSQIDPKFIFACDGYVYGGKQFDCSETVEQIIDALPTLEHVIWLPFLSRDAKCPASAHMLYQDVVGSVEDPGADDFEYAPVAFDHPLWVVYSSGTTGLPKPIVHGHGGITLEMYKFHAFLLDLKPGERNFFFTTTGWVMWNITISSLIVGASAIIYDGNPGHPDPEILWKMASEARATAFGASPTFIGSMMKAGIVPNKSFDFSSMKTVMLGGSPATPESMHWFYENVSANLWVTSQSGGTDVCSAFVGSSPLEPVRAGIIQAKVLGVDVCAFDDHGKEVIGAVGELVIRKPMPSMPIYFWGEDGSQRYKASYFEDYPGIWRHGDFVQFEEDGSCVIYGRSDSTLNRYGVRIGTSEIYRVVEEIDAVEDSIIVNLDLDDGKFFMPLFIKLKPGARFTEALQKEIKQVIREHCSPRHVPDRIEVVDDIPYTLTGKKMEVPVRKILLGQDPTKVASRDAMTDPKAIEYFVSYRVPQPVN